MDNTRTPRASAAVSLHHDASPVLCASCSSMSHSNIAPGAVFFFGADPPLNEDPCSLCAVVRGSYLEVLQTHLHWIHFPPKQTLGKSTPQHSIKMEVQKIAPTSSLEDECDLVVVKTTLQDTWYNDEVDREFYLHSNHSGSPCILKRDLPLESVPEYGGYGALSTYADLDLARIWIRECNQQHANCQPIMAAAPEEALQASTRFIDVRSRRLIPLDEIAERPFEYVALSYVWGVDYQVRTTTETISEFRERIPSSSDDDKSFRLPKTIEDAMEVTLALGYRYLWVDALCIIQVSPVDLKVQLAQMDRIYGLATLTIIGWSSRSSDSGLPGVSVPRIWLSGENLSCMIDSGLQIGCWDALDSHYEKDEEKHGLLADRTCYMWRGWTFQEQILSTRALEFNRRRLIFWCGCPEPSVEFGAAPGTDIRDAHHFRGAMRKYKDTGGEVSPGEEPWNYMTRDILISRWKTVREHFSTRQFSFHSDRRNAVLGTASMLRQLIGDVDSSGHLLSQLGVELLWRKTLHPGWNPDELPAIKFAYDEAPPGTYPTWSWLNLWPLTWPSDCKPFAGVDLQVCDAGDRTTLEIQGPTLQMSVVGDGETVAHYKDGTNSKLEVYFDRRWSRQRQLLASTIHVGKRVYNWCFGMLLLREIEESRFVRVGVAFVRENSKMANEFLRRINSDEGSHRGIVCV